MSTLFTLGLEGVAATHISSSWNQSLGKSIAKFGRSVGAILAIGTVSTIISCSQGHAQPVARQPQEVKQEKPTLVCLPDTPGIKVNLKDDGTVAWFETTDDDPVKFIPDKTLTDGTFDDGNNRCVETERSDKIIRECRMSGANYVWVDVSYLNFLCDGKTRRIFTSFKPVLDKDGELIHCPHDRYITDANNAKQFNEDWPGTNDLAAPAVSSQGLVRPIAVNRDGSSVLWEDMAGNEAKADYPAGQGQTSRWDWTETPPPAPANPGGPWQFPGGAETTSTAADGTKTYVYADGTKIISSPPDPNAPFQTDNPKTVTLIKPDKSKTVFKWLPNGKYIHTTEEPDEQKQEEKKVDEKQAGGVSYPPPRFADAANCPCRESICSDVKYETPAEIRGYTVATDTTKYCTFGDGTGVPYTLTPTDGYGNPVAPGITVSSDGTTPGLTTKIPVGTTVPPKTPSTAGNTPTLGAVPPPLAATTTDTTPTPDTSPPTNTPTPTTSDTTPPSTTDIPPTHITIFIKATQEVVTGDQTGQPIGGQIVKLIFDTPNFPSTQEQKTTDDVGYDMPAPQTSTDANGQGQIEISNDDEKNFGLTQNMTSGGKPVTHFSISLNLLKHDGAVGELTGHPMPDLNATLVPNRNFIAQLVHIGGHTYVRIGANTPYGTGVDLVDKLSKLFGIKFVVDICIIKEPGPPLGSKPATYGALIHDLPEASVKIGRTARMEAGR